MHRLPVVDAEHTERAEVPECIECGICCNFDDPRYVWIFEDDEARLTDEDKKLTHWDNGRLFMRVKDGHCAALEVKDGLSICSIYERRPFLCRDFVRGGELCEQTIARGTGVRLAASPAGP